MSDSVHSVQASASFGVVVMAASLGGLRAFEQVLSALPDDFPVPIVATQHRNVQDRDQLADLLDRSCHLSVRQAAEGEPLRTGAVHVVPAGCHALITSDERLTLSSDGSGQVPRCGDALLRSAATQYGMRAVGVVLTGRLDDAATGARAIKRAGGRVLVQSPDEARAGGMPSAALATGCVDLVLPLHLLGSALVALTMAPGGADLLKVALPPWADLVA